MADIDPLLSPHLCRALSTALSIDWHQELTCIDVSTRQIPWDIEARDTTDQIVLRISHTRAPWKDVLEAMPQMEDVRLGLEDALAQSSPTDILVAIHCAQSPKNKVERRKFGGSLAKYVQSAVRTLADSPAGSRVDVLAMADEANDQRSLELHSQLNSFTVTKALTGRGVVIRVSDGRSWRWMRPVGNDALERVADKVVRHGAEANTLVLLVEVEAEDTSPEHVAAFAASLPDEFKVFKALYLCDRNHSLTYRVLRVY